MTFPLVYELNVRCWLHDLSEAAGKPVRLGDVPPAILAHWQHLGFTHIWAMGVWEVGPLSRQAALADPQAAPGYSKALPDFSAKDVLGSPFAVADYRVAKSLGGESGLQRFRALLADHGLRLILDFVPNHTGLDHPWVRAHPDWYVHGVCSQPECFEVSLPEGTRWVAHGKDPNFPPWRDTAQLDYRNPDVHVAMTQVLNDLANRCDGVRCDMAMLLLKDVFQKTWGAYPAPPTPSTTDFWSGAIQSVKTRIPGFLLLAEGYWGLEPRLVELGFDYVYDKTLYDLVVARKHAEVSERLCRQGDAQIRSGAHFLENHDEIRIASLFSFFEHRAAILLMLGLPGLRLLHEGQLTGSLVRVPVQLGRRPSEPSQTEVEALYEHWLGVLQGTAVGRGEPSVLIPQSAWHGNESWRTFIVVQWQQSDQALDLVVVNLAPHRSQCYVPLKVPKIGDFNWAMEDLLGDEKYERNGDDLRNQGLYLDVGPFAAQVFHFRPV